MKEISFHFLPGPAHNQTTFSGVICTLGRRPPSTRAWGKGSVPADYRKTKMWRKTTFAGNYDSDQSISEEEDLASDWPENCIALCGTEERKEQIQIQSQLEVLRDTHERDHGTETSTVSNKRQTGFFSDEEVEFPVFHDDGGFISSPRLASLCNSEEEILSDNENPQEAGLRFPETEKGLCPWSVVTKEAEALAHLTENARCSSLRAVASKENKHVKGGQGKSKSKFLFHFQSHKEDMPLPVSSNPEVSISSKFLPLLQGLEAVDKSTTTNSMAELLDSYQEKTNSKMYKSMEAQRMQLVDERSVSLSGKIDMDNNIPPEDLDTESSSDDGVSPQDNAQNLGLIIPDSVQKAMSDKFQEAFGAASANEEGLHLPLHGLGLFGKLQRVMQREKKTEVDFMKKLEIGANLKDEATCFDVEILSRCLEAKLTVCCCLLRRDNEGFQLTESLQMAKGGQRRTLIIIFSSRVCEDVELEVGNLICIHSPWNEVLGKDEVIILSAYFSQILN
ncbi:uncharacterized protein LOC131298343 isoform X1 [Rhododendron vialii]|uniref:uncharacterized protein LOC131298343 isoform X1 n=1 Tax=Rhododendron vialii TaxID=182163 RepID=UPI00265E8957|nr:uncharacterized protein LOC131298343 isoform X1 [Rhododendron vialii]